MKTMENQEAELIYHQCWNLMIKYQSSKIVKNSFMLVIIFLIGTYTQQETRALGFLWYF